MLDLDVISEALAADVFVVFGASYIKGRLVDFLIEHQALNIHMGVSPYYRGSSCNFWALYDNNPALVGSTVHFLSKGLDSGSILFHALPKPGAVEPFVFTMSAVRAAFNGLLDSVKTGSWKSIEPIPQDRTKEIRYTRNSDFTDAVADEYLKRGLTSDALAKQLADAPEYPLLRAQRY
jgi:methionyl-tRNA formyltransferase